MAPASIGGRGCHQPMADREAGPEGAYRGAEKRGEGTPGGTGCQERCPGPVPGQGAHKERRTAHHRSHEPDWGTDWHWRHPQDGGI